MNPRVYSKRKGAEPPPKDAVYVGRGTRWGNPFKIGRDGDRDKCIRAYRIMVESHAPTVQAIRRELRGKDLVCWCAPEPCHADVLLEIANGQGS